MNINWKKLIIHPAAVLILLVFAAIYFKPSALDGKVLGQSDVMQAGGTQVELKQYMASEGREILWTNGMFSGMPSFQVYGANGDNYNVLGNYVYRSFLMFNSVSSAFGLLFASLLGIYILLITLKVDWRLAILGAITYGLSTSNMILIEAGHVNKMLVLAFLAPTLAGIISIFRGNYIWGAAITALFTCCQVMGNHPQITYYFYILVGFFVLAQLIQAAMSKHIAPVLKSIGTLVIAVLIGIMPNIAKMWTTFEYSKESIRGITELQTDGKTPAEGLTKDYAFDMWSFSKMESFTLLVPNFMGGSASENFIISDRGQIKDSKYSEIQNVKDQKDQQDIVQAGSNYWGKQSFVSGAWYWGAVSIFFFFLGFYTQRGALKWWSLASVALILMISWGSNFPNFNFFLFDHFPLFNKFRDPKMIIAIGHIFMVAFGFVGLQRFFSESLTDSEKQKSLMYAAATVLGLLFIAILYGFMGSFEGPNDVALESKFPEILRMIRADRASLLSADAYRSLMYIVLAAGTLYASLRFKINQWIAIPIVALIGLIDLGSVDNRYFDMAQFKDAKKTSAYASPTAADKEILKDKTNYRVLDLTASLTGSARASYFHKSLGGYHAAKLMRYQELVENQIQPDIQMAGSLLNQVKTADQLPLVFKNTPALNMLNTKYLILDEKQSIPNPSACGNAWFVSNIERVSTPNAEMDSLKNLNPATTVIIGDEFAKSVEGFKPSLDSTNSIKLTKYVPDDLTYSSNAKTEQLAVFSEIYYPESKGWNVYVDGTLTPNAIIRANYAIRAMRVPAGAHTIEMKFEPKSYYTGQKISRFGTLLLMLLVGGGLFFMFKKLKRAEDLEAA